MSGKATPERLAALVAEALWPRMQAELREALAELEHPAHDERIDAKEAAKRYGHTPRWWRDHADEFGAERDGDGPRPRIVFSVASIERVRERRRIV
jgi:hypothetical protein